ncbi:hypothetical protein LZ31DRAFT_52782 [Colletotrichum somersetense]|nr:hypothetical protein LZ31DRAFT_52782 [Colletotrichum somersetense]
MCLRYVCSSASAGSGSQLVRRGPLADLPGLGRLRDPTFKRQAALPSGIHEDPEVLATRFLSLVSRFLSFFFSSRLSFSSFCLLPLLSLSSFSFFLFPGPAVGRLLTEWINT